MCPCYLTDYRNGRTHHPCRCSCHRNTWTLTPRGEKVAAALHGIVIAGGTAAIILTALLLAVMVGE